MADDRSRSMDPSSSLQPGWIDISLPLRNAMLHWPTDAPPKVQRIQDVDRGDPVTLTKLTVTSHTGTHIDAPLHFIPHGETIDHMPLDTTVGPARIIEINDEESIKPRDLAVHRIRRGQRILFKTRNSSRVYRTDDFVEDYVFLTIEAARFLVEKGVRLVGVDCLSVGAIKDPDSLDETHRVLLGGGIYILEGLDLSRVEAGRYELVCLPLRLARGDGAPARAILRPAGSRGR